MVDSRCDDSLGDVLRDRKLNKYTVNSRVIVELVDVFQELH